MKKVIVFIFLLLFYFCYVSSKLSFLAIPPIDIPCVCCPVEGFKIDCIPPEFFLSEDLEKAIGEMSQALKELSQDSKSSLPITLRLNILLKKIKNALSLSSDECNELISTSINRTDPLISKLQNKKCTGAVTKKCIREESLNEFLPRIQESLEELKSILSIDDDESGIPDVCRG